MRPAPRVSIKPGQPHGPEYMAREFRIEYRVGEEWKTVVGAEWSNNLEPKVSLVLKEPLTTDAIRLRILSQSDDGQGNYRACCQELEATETNSPATKEE